MFVYFRTGRGYLFHKEVKLAGVWDQGFVYAIASATRKLLYINSEYMS